LSDLHAEAVAARGAGMGCEGMGDPRLRGLQGQPQGAEPRGDHLLTALHHGAVLREEHAVISLDHDGGRRPVLGAPTWQSLGDGRLQAVERKIGPSR
jgi:hypothetical protein